MFFTRKVAFVLMGVFAAILAALVVVLVLPGTSGTDGVQGADVPVLRPAMAYAPKATPLRPAARPDLGAIPAVPARRSLREDVSQADDTDAGEPAGGAEVDREHGEGADGGEGDESDGAVFPPPLRDDDPVLAGLARETAFLQSAWDAVSSCPDAAAAFAESADLLRSDSPEDRALGGILAYFAGGLEGELLGYVLADSDPVVPLTVGDWIRDHGTEEEAARFRDALRASGVAPETLREFAAESAGLPGGGRTALDAFLAMCGEDVPVADLLSLVASPNASYDVREQALFKLLEPETRTSGEEALSALAAGAGDNGVLPFAASKLALLALVSNPDGDSEKVWDSESPVVFFLANSEGGLQARDLANYLEYALRRDDPEFPPIIEEGTWEFANEFLLSAKDGLAGAPLSEIDSLDRIATYLDRLVEYDPAFHPFETVEEDGDEFPPEDPDEDGEDGEEGHGPDVDDGDVIDEDVPEVVPEDEPDAARLRRVETSSVPC